MMRMGSRSRRTLGAVAVILLALGAWILSRSQDASRVGPGAAVAPELAVSAPGAALPEDARAPIAPESTLAGSGSGVGTSVPSDPPLAPAPAEGAAPPPTWGAHVLPTRVVFVDAVTGREVPEVRWWEPVITLRDGVISTSQARRSGESAPLMPPWGQLVVEPLADWVYLGSRAISLRRMPRAREGRMTVLLYPEVDVRVEILSPDGRAAEGAQVTDAFIAGTTVRPVREERAPDGTRRLRGIPFFAGETLHLAAHWTGPPTDAPVDLELPELSEEDPAALPGWHGPMPDRPDATIRALIRLAGPTGIRDHSESDNDLPTEESLGETPPPDPSVLGTVRLQLVDRDGKPVPGVRVAVRGVEGTTDEDGRVALERIEQGKLPLIVRDDGWTFPTTSVTVVGRQVTEVVVREIVGGDVEIFVRDVDGNPVPFAALEVQCPDCRAWFDVDDAGIQRLDPYVDVRGRRLLTHLPPGTLRVQAIIGTRRGRGEVEVVDRGRRVLPITVSR